MGVQSALFLLLLSGPSVTPATLSGHTGHTTGGHQPAAAAHHGGGTALPNANASAAKVWEWRESAREAVHHAFDSYMTHAYPYDELKPLSCSPRRWDARDRGTLDDPLGGFGLTLVDSLDTLAMLGELPRFRCGVSLAVRDVAFTNSVPVSVFETNIRMLGGLLSAHQLAADPALALWPAHPYCGSSVNASDWSACSAALCGGGCGAPCLREYRGELLTMALELGARLLPAFDTPSGIPFHRIDLARGAPDTSSRETCTAAGGTFMMEFGLLSRLSGDPVFESVARRAASALWIRRASSTGLVGSSIDAIDGQWRAAHTGIGAGVDSFYEYLLKAGILLDDEGLLAAWEALADSVATHTVFGDMHLEVGVMEGRAAPRPPIISSLQAFWPGLEVLAGRVGEARDHLRPLLSLWAKHKALPELYDLNSGTAVHFAKDAPLRPELAESVYHVYTATRDPALLAVAGSMIETLQGASRVACGFASVADVTTGRLDDRMDSYFIAETLKYLFLTFDAALWHWGDGAPLLEQQQRATKRESGGGAGAAAAAHMSLAPPPGLELSCGCGDVRATAGAAGARAWGASVGGELGECDRERGWNASASRGADEGAAAPDSAKQPSPAALLGDFVSASEEVSIFAAGPIDGSRSQPYFDVSHAADDDASAFFAAAAAAAAAAGTGGSSHPPLSHQLQCAAGGAAAAPTQAPPRSSPDLAARCKFYCMARSLYPRAHSLAFQRSDEDLHAPSPAAAAAAVPLGLADSSASQQSGSDVCSDPSEDAVSPVRLASLPLREDRLIFTTEGHVLQISRAVQRGVPPPSFPLGASAKAASPNPHTWTNAAGLQFRAGSEEHHRASAAADAAAAATTSEPHGRSSGPQVPSMADVSKALWSQPIAARVAASAASRAAAAALRDGAGAAASGNGEDGHASPQQGEPDRAVADDDHAAAVVHGVCLVAQLTPAMKWTRRLPQQPPAVTAEGAPDGSGASLFSLLGSRDFHHLPHFDSKIAPAVKEAISQAGTTMARQAAAAAAARAAQSSFNSHHATFPAAVVGGAPSVVGDTAEAVAVFLRALEAAKKRPVAGSPGLPSAPAGGGPPSTDDAQSAPQHLALPPHIMAHLDAMVTREAEEEVAWLSGALGPPSHRPPRYAFGAARMHLVSVPPALQTASPATSTLLILRNTSSMMHFLRQPVDSSSGGGDDGGVGEPAEGPAGTQRQLESFDDGSCPSASPDDDAAADWEAPSSSSPPNPGGGAGPATSMVSGEWSLPHFVPFDGPTLARVLSAVPHFTSAVEAVVVQCDALSNACGVRTVLASDPPRVMVHLRVPRLGGEEGAPGSYSSHAAHEPPAALSRRALGAQLGEGDVVVADDDTAVDDSALRFSSAHSAELARAHVAACHLPPHLQQRLKPHGGESDSPSPSSDSASATGMTADRTNDLEAAEEPLPYSTIHPEPTAAAGGDPAPSSSSSDLFLSAAPGQFGPLLTPLGLSDLTFELVSPLGACSTLLRRRRRSDTAHVGRGRVFVALRGDCSFVTKARYAQTAGATALLVLDVDHRGFASKGDAPQPPPFVMSDDGTGSDIAIPVAMMGGAQSRLLLHALGVVDSSSSSSGDSSNANGRAIASRFDLAEIVSAPRAIPHSLVLRAGAVLGCMFLGEGAAAVGHDAFFPGWEQQQPLHLVPHPNRLVAQLLPSIFSFRTRAAEALLRRHAADVESNATGVVGA